MSVAALAGRYEIERKLGGGGMAVVYLAQDRALGRAVAVKCLAEHLAGDDEARERFLREARMAAGLSHPNVVSVFDAGEDDGRPYLVMELVEGETVADELSRKKRFAPAEAIELALQACAGLEHAHAAGVIHRDVKPGNFLRRADGVVKIADFGIARAATAPKVTQTGTVLGTAAYLAPEQAAGEKLTPAADLYSLGAVLYELLTRRTPYEFGSLPELAYKQRTEAIQPVRELAPDVSPALEAVVMRCLARNPEYRPASAAALAEELEAALPEPPTEPLPRPTRPAARQLSTRDRRLWLVVGALATGAAIVALVLVPKDGSGEKPSPNRPSVQPVAPAASPSERARNLADWLRANAE